MFVVEIRQFDKSSYGSFKPVTHNAGIIIAGDQIVKSSRFKRAQFDLVVTFLSYCILTLPLVILHQGVITRPVRRSRHRSVLGPTSVFMPALARIYRGYQRRHRLVPPSFCAVFTFWRRLRVSFHCLFHRRFPMTSALSPRFNHQFTGFSECGSSRVCNAANVSIAVATRQAARSVFITTSFH